MLRSSSRFLAAAFLATLAVCAVGCRKPVVFDPMSATEEALASRELESVTQGVVGARGPIVIKFRHPWAADDEVGKDASSKWLKFEPSIDGRLWWKDHQTLVFEPEEDLEPGKLHVGTLDLPGLTDDKRLPEYRFAVVSATRMVELEPQGFEKSQGDLWKLSTRVEFSSPPKGTAEKWFDVDQDGADLKIEWTPSGADDGSGILVVDGIRRNGEKLSIKVDADEAGLESDVSLPDMKIPLAEKLGVLWAGQRGTEGRNGFDVLLSDPAAPVPDLEGLAKVEGAPGAVQIEQNGARLRLSWVAKPGAAKLVLESGLPGTEGRKLENRFELSGEFADSKPMVMFRGSGNILPSPGGNQIHFFSVNLSRVRVVVRRVDPSNIPEFLYSSNFSGNGGYHRQLGEVVWDRVIQLGAKRNTTLEGSLDLGQMLSKNGAGLYTVELEKQRQGMLYACDEQAKTESGAIGERRQDDASDESEGDGDYEDMRWGERDNPCAPSYWYQGWDERVSRNVLVSDLGLMAWRDPNGNLVGVAHDLVTAEPWKGVKIEVLKPNDAVAAQGETDGEGFAELAGTQSGTLVRASVDKGGKTHLGYLRLNDGEARNVSKFDVGGESDPDGLRLFLYSERGVYRPGDSIFLGCILRGEDGKVLDRLPVKMTLRDPQGRAVATTVQRSAADGHFAWRMATRPEDATGRWSVLAEAGPAQTTLPVLVETVRPNRMKIELDAKSIQVGGQNTTIRSHWLSGGSAAGLQAKVEMSLSPKEIAPKGMEGYSFEDPTRERSGTDEAVVWEGALNAEGAASFRLPVPDEGVSGPMTAWVRSRVFEPGGQASVDRVGLPLWPFGHYAGLRVRTRDGWDWTSTGEPIDFDVVSVGTDLKPAQGRKMEIVVYRNSRWWWWENGERYLGFLDRSETREVARLSTVSGQGVVFKPDSSGQYLVMAKDLESGHVAGASFHAWGRGDDAGGQASQAPVMLRLQAAKDTVEPGQELEVRFPSAKSGKALVQVMRGRRILSQEWINTSGGEASWKTKVTGEMRPGVYVQVTQLQTWPVPTDRPLRMWGLVPVAVVDPATRLKPEIELPAELRPESKARIRIREGGKRPMRAMVAVVDEGLLDLTRFKTPDPWPTFYGKEALRVVGWDMHDQVMEAWEGRVDRLFAVGGDDDARRKMAGAKGNPFPPMVVVKGPIEIPKGGADVEIDVPRYTGSVRVMVVASSATAFGSAEKAVPVRAPVMALLTVPRGMAPGDKADVPVTVFSDRKGSVSVKLSLEGGAAIEGGSERSVQFKEAGDQVVTFSVKASALGTVAVHAVASGAHGKASVDQPLEVRLPGEMRAIVQEGSPLAGQVWSAPFEAFGAEGTRKMRLEFSSIGLLGLERRLDDLIHYPHGCLEQTMSGALPQVFLRKLLPGADETRLKQADANVAAGLEKLRTFQTASGAFSLWPGEGRPYEWGTLWAGRFLLAAKAAGHAPPATIWDPYLLHLVDASARWKPGAYAHRGDTLAQVVRLDILAQAGKPDLARMNQLRPANLRDLERWILAAAYVSAGRSDAGQELAAKAGTSVSDARSLGEWLWSDVRDRAMMLEAMVRVGEQEKALELFKSLRATVRDGNVWLSTQEGGTVLWSFASWLEKRGSGPAFDAQWRVGGGAWKNVSGSKGAVLVDVPVNATGPLEVRNSGKGALDVLFTRIGIDPPGTPPPPAKGLRLSVEYRDAKGAAVDPASIKLGDDFRIHATITNETNQYLDNLAMVQVFPGGWEIRNDRLEGAAGAESNAMRRVEFRDDRVFHYLALAPGKSASVVVGARAAYAGTYLRPGAFVSAMYDGAIQAAATGGTAVVAP